MFIIKLIFEIIVYIIVDFIFFMLFGAIGASVRWLFLYIIGKPRTMKELRTRTRKLRKRGISTDELRNGNPFTDAFIGMVVILIVIAIIIYFSE